MPSLVGSEMCIRDSYHIRRCPPHTHTPLGRLSKLDCSTTKRVPNTERGVFGKLSARCFQRRLFRHRHHSNIPTTAEISSTENRRRGLRYTTAVYGCYQYLTRVLPKPVNIPCHRLTQPRYFRSWANESCFFLWRLFGIALHTIATREVNEARLTDTYSRPCALEAKNTNKQTTSRRIPNTPQKNTHTAARRPRPILDGLRRNKSRVLAQARPLL